MSGLSVNAVISVSRGDNEAPPDNRTAVDREWLAGRSTLSRRHPCSPAKRFGMADRAGRVPRATRSQDVDMNTRARSVAAQRRCGLERTTCES